MIIPSGSSRCFKIKTPKYGAAKPRIRPPFTELLKAVLWHVDLEIECRRVYKILLQVLVTVLKNNVVLRYTKRS